MKEIAKQNDEFRRQILRSPAAATYPPGGFMQTSGVADLEPSVKLEILCKVHSYNEFTKDNDPYGEHDFGNFECCGHSIYWKIDYYADSSYTYGSEDPADPARCHRMLTVMLQEEY